MENRTTTFLSNYNSKFALLEGVLSFAFSIPLANILFFNWNVIYGPSGKYFPPSGVVWSLSIEEQFYIGISTLVLTFRVFASKPKSFRKIFTILLFAIWLISTASRILFAIQDFHGLAHDDTGNPARIYFGTDARISSIASGGLVALLASIPLANRKIVKLLSSHRIYVLVLTASLFLISLSIRDQFFRDTFLYTIQELSISLLILSGPVLNAWPEPLRRVSNNSVIQAIGKSSYSLYLSHQSVILAISTVLHSVESQINPYFWKALTGVTCLCLGYVAHKCFDAPFELRRKSARRAS